MNLRALLTDPTERRNSLIAIALIATAVAILGFGAGPGSILGPSAAHGATPDAAGSSPGVMTANAESPPSSDGDSSAGDSGDGMAMEGMDDSSDGGTDASPSSSTTDQPVPPTCPGLSQAVLDPFVVHFKAAHMERSPSEQASDLADADRYTKTHTVLFENMLDPTFGVMTGSSGC